MIYLLLLFLVMMVIFGATGFVIVYFSGRAKAFRKGLSKKDLLRYALYGWILTLTVCFSLSALIVLQSQTYSIGPTLVVLSFGVSIVSTLLLMANYLFSNILNKKVGKYFVFNKDGKLVSLKEIK